MTTNEKLADALDAIEKGIAKGDAISAQQGLLSLKEHLAGQAAQISELELLVERNGLLWKGWKENAKQPGPDAGEQQTFDQWWLHHGLPDPMDDSDQYYSGAIGWAKRAFSAASCMKTHMPSDVPLQFATSVEVKPAASGESKEMPNG